MKPINILIGSFVLMLIGCGTAPVKPTKEMQQLVFDKPITAVQKAAVDAMSTIGCDIVKNQPTYVECSRPHKIGLFVGSGGETVSVYLEEQSPTKTLVHVNTAKSFAGIIGQKEWSAEIIQEMVRSLGSSE
jgi:hypothetical protein